MNRFHFLLSLLFFGVILVGQSRAKAAAPTRVWIDSDPALGMLFRDADDGFALVQALHSPQLEIAGISIVRGNSAIPDGSRIARQILAHCPHRPFENVFPGKTTRERSAAAEGLHIALERPLTYIALGPLTNLVEYLRTGSARAKMIRRIIFIGGEWPHTDFRAGGWNPYRFTDANFYKDPVAAGIVIESGIPITFVPIDVARKISLSAADMRVLRKSDPCPAWVANRAGGWFLGWRIAFGVKEAPVFDALPLFAVSDPQSVERRPIECRIERRNGKSRLFLSPLQPGKPSRYEAITAFDPQLRETVIERLLASGSP